MYDLKIIKFMNTPKEVAKRRHLAYLTNNISPCGCPGSSIQGRDSRGKTPRQTIKQECTPGKNLV